MNYCLFYGSLKSNHYNFGRFDGQKVVKKILLPDYELFNLGPYPAACPGKGIITCELQTVSDAAINYIRQMEAGAGYREVQIELEDLNVKASLFVMDKNQLKRYKKVANGDW